MVSRCVVDQDVGLTERGSVEHLAAETVVGAEPLPEHIVDVGHAVGERLSLLARVRELSDVGLRLSPDARRQRGRVLQHVLVHLQLVLDLRDLVRDLLGKLCTLPELLPPCCTSCALFKSCVNSVANCASATWTEAKIAAEARRAFIRGKCMVTVLFG